MKTGLCRRKSYLEKSLHSISAPPYTAYAWIRHALLLTGSKPSPDGRNIQCPAHHDSEPSLAVTAGRTGAVLHCLAGCAPVDVLARIGLGLRHLYAPPSIEPAAWLALAGIVVSYPPVTIRAHPLTAGYRLESIHPYGAYRLLRYRHPVTRDKMIEWERRSNGVWVPGLGGAPLATLPLYRAREARWAILTDDLLVIVESESSADALASRGIYATTWAGGAGTVQTGRLGLLRNGRRLLIVPDHDPAGLAALGQIRSVLESAAVLLPDPGDDARDLLVKQGTGVFTRGGQDAEA